MNRLYISLFQQNIDFPLPCPLEVFEMLVVPEHTCPLICVAVSKGTELNQVVRFGTINPNSTSSWFTEAGEDQLRLTEQDCVPHVDWAKPSVVLCCRHTADVCDSHHSARERHYLGLPGQWVTRVLLHICIFALWGLEYLSNGAHFPSSLRRMYKDCKSPGEVEVQQEVISRTHLQFSDRSHR